MRDLLCKKTFCTGFNRINFCRKNWNEHFFLISTSNWPGRFSMHPAVELRRPMLSNTFLFLFLFQAPCLFPGFLFLSSKRYFVYDIFSHWFQFTDSYFLDNQHFIHINQFTAVYGQTLKDPKGPNSCFLSYKRFRCRYKASGYCLKIIILFKNVWFINLRGTDYNENAVH